MLWLHLFFVGIDDVTLLALDRFNRRKSFKSVTVELARDLLIGIAEVDSYSAITRFMQSGLLRLRDPVMSY